MNPPPLPDVWPDFVDGVALAVYFGGVLTAVMLGYVLAYLDWRAYLRSLTRALVRVAASDQTLPEWAAPVTPRSIAVFGLQLPCTEEELLGAYRRKVKKLHPDRGGNQRRFMLLQAQFEEALATVRRYESAVIAARFEEPPSLNGSANPLGPGFGGRPTRAQIRARRLLVGITHLTTFPPAPMFG